MTDLERFFRRLVANLAGTDPARLHRPIPLEDIHRVHRAVSHQPPRPAAREQRGLRAGAAPALRRRGRAGPDRAGGGSGPVRRGAASPNPDLRRAPPRRARRWSRFAPSRSRARSGPTPMPTCRTRRRLRAPAAVRPRPPRSTRPSIVARSSRRRLGDRSPSPRRRPTLARRIASTAATACPADRPVRFCPHCGQRQSPPDAPGATARSSRAGDTA